MKRRTNKMTDRYSSYNKLKFDFSAGGDFGLIEKMTGNLDEIMTTWKEAKDLVYNIINCNNGYNWRYFH